MKKLFFLFILIGQICSCNKQERYAVLENANSILKSHPDSALVLLMEIPNEQLSQPGTRARHSLMVTIAKERCDREDLDTALMSSAYNYYSRYGSKKDRMLSAFYLGCAKEFAEDDLDASELFRESEYLAEQLNDNIYLGFACRHLSTLFARNYDDISAIAAARKSIASFEKINDTLSADFSRTSLARSLFGMMRFDSAEAIIDSLLHSSTADNPSLKYNFNVLKGDVCYQRKQYLLAESYFDKAMELYELDIIRKFKVAVTKRKNGHIEEADVIRKQIREQCQTQLDSIAMHDCEHHFAVMNGNYRLAYEEAKIVSDIQNRIIMNKLDRSITHAQKNYLEQRLEIEQKKRLLSYSLFIMAFLVLTLILFICVSALLQRKRQIITEMAKVNNLTQDLTQLQNIAKGAGAVISSLVQDKIFSMQTLSDTYLSWSEESVAYHEEKHGRMLRDDILFTFRKQLRFLRNDERFIPSIEKALDLSCQNIMHNLRTQFSDKQNGHAFKEIDFRFLTLFFAGFSSKSISFIMDSTEDAVRARKSRYRKLFASLGAPAEVYLKKVGAN